MYKKLHILVCGCCLMVLLGGCTAVNGSRIETVNRPDSPVMKDLYTKSVPGDVYTKEQITPP